MRNFFSTISKCLYRPSRAFDRIVTSRGGIFTGTGPHHQFLRQVASTSLDELTSEPFFAVRNRLFVNLVDNWDPNALAFFDGRWNHIGVYRGTVATVASLFHAATRSDAVWPEIQGDTDHEDAFQPLVLSLADRRNLQVNSHALPLSEKGASPLLYEEPINPDRLALLGQMMATAWQFLIYHEFAHFVRGHLDLAEKECKIKQLCEATSSNARSIGAAKRLQAFELDADRLAIHFLADKINWRGKWNGNFSSTDGWPPAVVLRLQLVVVVSLLEIFDWQSATLDEFVTNDHPHPGVRLIAIMEHVEALADEFAVDSEIVQAAFDGAFQDLEQIGASLNWTLLQVVSGQATEFEKQKNDISTHFGKDELGRGVELLFKRLRLNV